MTTWSPGATRGHARRRRPGRRRSPRARRRSGTARRGWSAAGARRSGRGRRRPSRPAPRPARGRGPRARRSRTRSPAWRSTAALVRTRPPPSARLRVRPPMLPAAGTPPATPRPAPGAAVRHHRRMPPAAPPSRPRPVPGCGAVLVRLGRRRAARTPGASASCARLFEVTLRGLREEARADAASAAAVRLADAAYDAQHADPAIRTGCGAPWRSSARRPPPAQAPAAAWRTTIADVAADLDVIDLAVLVEAWAGRVARGLDGRRRCPRVTAQVSVRVLQRHTERGYAATVGELSRSPGAEEGPDPGADPRRSRSASSTSRASTP